MTISVIKVYILFIFVDLSTCFDWTDGAPSKLKNISCVLYAKRILTCNYDVPDNVQRDLTTCTACSQSIELQTPNDTCPDAFPSLACNTSVGKCVYDCDSLEYCEYYHILNVTLTGSDDTEAVSMCGQIRTDRHIQPGPVRNLSVTAINSTTLHVEWKKPHDRYRYYDVYRYVVRYRDGKKHVMKLNTTDEDIGVVLTDLVPRGNYNITVWARPRRWGFRSIPQTVSTSVEGKNFIAYICKKYQNAEQRPTASSDAKGRR
ncbi:uncharacterized protein LOC124267013 [Haliotis rubra]|uniref:uncharacterized protein LOC124267013 n=1 Tax=Haliotis rubra TaxID=36100 RepID=UPI001EE52C58|nr:uncharacterized protein LOC124267013 [Haliotis rubra]